MPSHVYHEVDLAALGDGEYWVSWGEPGGEILTAEEFVHLFLAEFTFDTRYSIETRPFNQRPATPILACFVSSGGDDIDELCIYAYELKDRGAYNQPKDKDTWEVKPIYHWHDPSEQLALTAMAYTLLSRAEWMKDQEEEES